MRFRAGGGSVDAVEVGVPDGALTDDQRGPFREATGFTDAGPLPMCRKDL